MTRLWYRHWLELRPMVVVYGIVVAIMALLYPVFLHSASEYLEQTGRLAGEIVALGPVIDRVPRTTVIPWGLHVTFAGFLAIFMPFLAYGSGLGVKNPSWRAVWQASSTFTLSLPVSPVEVVLTRIVAGAAATAFLIASLLAANSIAVVLSGRPLPLWLMTMASLRAIVLMTAVVACFSMFAVVLGERVAATLVFGALIIGSLSANALWWPAAAKHFVAGAGWGPMGIALATAVVCTTVAALIADKTEY
jgi:hypothetical protein